MYFRNFIFFTLLQWFFLIFLTPPYVLAGQWDAYSSRQKQQQMVFSSQKLYNKKKLQLSRKSFRNDCSGFVKAVMWDNGHSLDDFYRAYRYQTNGVSLIHKYVERVGLVTRRQKPQKGDIVFFSNTYDKNKDGRVNDDLTHIGVVEKIDRNGTVTFLHYIHNRVRRGFMNLKKPSTHIDDQDIINTYLRRKNRYTSKTLAAQLFEGFGRLEPDA